jgi:hypothetical protein
MGHMGPHNLIPNDNKKSQTIDKGNPSSWGLMKGLKTPHPKNRKTAWFSSVPPSE